MRKKLLIFISICLAGFAGQMSPNSNQLTFILQIPTYGVTEADMLNSVAAALAGWMAGPFIISPLAGVIGRSAVIFWSLVATFLCQIWAGEMTGPDDYIPFVLSRVVCGLFGVMPAIMGPGYIMDMFFLHQRGKAFAIFEVLIIFAVVGGGTLGGFVANSLPWDYVFWWTLGPIGGAMIAVFAFVEDTTFSRDPNMPSREPLPKAWLANRLVTFFPGTRTQPAGKMAELVSATTTRSALNHTVTEADLLARNAELSCPCKSPAPLSPSSSAPTSSLLSAFPSCRPRRWPSTSHLLRLPAATASPLSKLPSSP